VKPIAILFCATLLLMPAVRAATPAASEREVWAMEDAYWRYVQGNDLAGYRTLWSRDFLGWPLSSPEPVRNDRITGWITAHTEAGEGLKSYRLERLLAQASGELVTVTYRVRMTWVTQAGVEKPGSLRVIHTWRRTAAQWQIISGMAAPTDAQGH
jgi:ketosteroid isomerase-like protein